MLIDDSFTAGLCNFGLSRIKADTSNRTVRVNGILVERTYWIDFILRGRRTGDIGRYTETRKEMREIENGCGHASWVSDSSRLHEIGYFGIWKGRVSSRSVNNQS